MERFEGEYTLIEDKIGCSNNPHRKQPWSPIVMTDSILTTGNTGTAGAEEVVRQLSEKRHQLLEIRSIFESHLNPRRDHGKKTNDYAQVCRGLCREGA